MPVKTYFGPVQDLEKQIARCSKCEEWKPFSEFSPERPGKKRVVQSWCKPCACEDWRRRMIKNGSPDLVVTFADFKKCDHCGLEKPISEMLKKRKRSIIPGVRPMCLDCNRIKKQEAYNKSSQRILSLQRKKQENPKQRASRIFSGIKSRATEVGMEIDLTKEWVEERLYRGVCEVTGVEFSLANNSFGRNLLAPSVDRIDSAKGYTRDNCKMVIFCYNLAKSNGTHDDVAAMAAGLVQKEKEKWFSGDLIESQVCSI